MSDLKPCEKCGAPDPNQDPTGSGWIVYCHKCGHSVDGPSRDETFAAWNRRTPAAVSVEAIDGNLWSEAAIRARKV